MSDELQTYIEAARDHLNVIRDSKKPVELTDPEVVSLYKAVRALFNAVEMLSEPRD